MYIVTLLVPARCIARTNYVCAQWIFLLVTKHLRAVALLFSWYLETSAAFDTLYEAATLNTRVLSGNFKRIYC